MIVCDPCKQDTICDLCKQGAVYNTVYDTVWLLRMQCTEQRDYTIAVYDTVWLHRMQCTIQFVIYVSKMQ